MSNVERQESQERNALVDRTKDQLQDLERRYRNVTETNRALIERKQQQMRSLVGQLATTEQRERKQLATELHDYLAQMMVLGRIKVRKARSQADLDAPMLMKSIDDVDEIFSKSLMYTRNLMSELNPPVLHEWSLSTSLACLAEEMSRHGLHVDVEIAKLPTAFPEDQCMMLYQSVRELLINVVKHANTSCAKVCLSIDDSEHLRIVVKDSGSGFDVGAIKMTAAGRHFGLANIRERMEAIGGWLEMESSLDQGTRVTLGLPLNSGDDVEKIARGTPSTKPMKAASSSEKSNPIRVMLVDDHALVRQGLRIALESYDDLAVVAEASNGLEAVCLAADEMPEVIIMDVVMPKMDGIEATRQIKSFCPQAHIIAMTADNPSNHVTAATHAGAAACVSKEVDLQELHDTVFSLAETKRPKYECN